MIFGLFVLNVLALVFVRGLLVYRLMTMHHDVYMALGSPGLVTNSYGFIFPLWQRISAEHEEYGRYRALIVAIFALFCTVVALVCFGIISSAV